MLLLLILPLLISGYAVQRWHFYHKYQLHRYTGQLLYLKSAYLGAICLTLSFILCTVLVSIKPFYIFDTKIGLDILELLANLLKEKFNIERKSLPFSILLTFNSIIVAYIWSKFSNSYKIILHFLEINKEQFKKIEKQEVTLKKAWELSKFYYILSLKHELFRENPLDDLLLNSYENFQDIMIHMNDRKVYIGFVMTLSEPNESDALAQEISIIPLKSGYRDKDNLTVNITTNYSAEDKLFIILRRDEIVSATVYNADIFKNFQSKPSSVLAESSFIQRIDNYKKLSVKD